MARLTCSRGPPICGDQAVLSPHSDHSAWKPAGSWASAGVPTRPAPLQPDCPSLQVTVERLAFLSSDTPPSLGHLLRPVRQQPQEGLTPTTSYVCFRRAKSLISAWFSLVTFERTFASRPGEEMESPGRREGRKKKRGEKKNPAKTKTTQKQKQNKIHHP